LAGLPVAVQNCTGKAISLRIEYLKNSGHC
jgi:hypothetical protein